MSITMPVSPPAGNPFLDPATPTLASVSEALERAELTPRRRTELMSAVRSCCRVLGKAPCEVPADPGVLGRTIRRALPAAAGITPARWSNIKSLLLKAMEITGCRVLPGRSLHPLTPPWAELYEGLQGDRYFRASLSRLMHFCSAQRITPLEVDQSVFDRFGQAIVKDSFIRNQSTAYQNAIRLWNRAADSIADWPKARISEVRYHQPYALPLSAFPATFQAEAQDWLDRLAGRTGLLDDGPSKPLRPRSIEQRRFYLRQAASALVHRGRAIAEINGLVALVSIAAFRDILNFFLERSGNRPTSQIHGIATHLKAIARHYVGVAPADLEKLGQMVRKVAPPQQGLTTKNRLALKQLEDPLLLARLIRLPAETYARLPREGELTPRKALAFQMALAVQILLSAPIRLGNLARLEFDRHLIRIGTVRRSRYHLFVPGDEVKNGRAVELPLPVEAVELIETYRRRIRPGLAQPGTAWLLPGKAGPKTLNTLGRQISRFLVRELGLRLSPHQFRHAVGFIYLRAHPHGHVVVRELLGCGASGVLSGGRIGWWRVGSAEGRA
jgi:integrase